MTFGRGCPKAPRPPFLRQSPIFKQLIDVGHRPTGSSPASCRLPRASSSTCWKGYRHGAAFGLEPNGCAHRSRASAHSSEQMQPSEAVARVQINGAARVAQILHMPASISDLIKSVDPKEGPALREAL